MLREMAEFRAAIIYIYPFRINNMDSRLRSCYLQNYLNYQKAPPMTYTLRQAKTPIRRAKNENAPLQPVQKYQTEIKHDR
jgi:hypothetical protein